MKRSLIVLIDFSPFAVTQLKLADLWSAALQAELLLVHHFDVIIPAMADFQLRAELFVAKKEQAIDKLRELAINHVRKGTLVEYHVTEEPLLLTVRKLLQEREHSLVMAGLKGTGFLKRIYPGSTVTKLVDELDAILTAIPKNAAIAPPATLYVSVYHKYPLNETAFLKLLDMLGNQVEKIIFLTAFANEKERSLSSEYQAALAQKYAPVRQTGTEMFEGADAFTLLKTYMSNHPGGLLVLQRGARSLTDHLSRKFLVNELVYDATLPLIILPS